MQVNSQRELTSVRRPYRLTTSVLWEFQYRYLYQYQSAILNFSYKEQWHTQNSLGSLSLLLRISCSAKEDGCNGKLKIAEFRVNSACSLNAHALRFFSQRLQCSCKVHSAHNSCDGTSGSDIFPLPFAFSVDFEGTAVHRLLRDQTIFNASLKVTRPSFFGGGTILL